MNPKNTPINKRRKSVRILIFVGCIILLIFGILFTFGGLALVAYNAGTDADGYSQSNIYEVRSSTHAFALWVGSSQYPSYLKSMSPKDVGQCIWTVESVNSKELFVGWANGTDGEDYLFNKFRFETPPEWRWYINAYYAEIEINMSIPHNQGEPTRPPAEETFWLESVQSNDTAKIVWDAFWEPDTELKVLIIMNSDGSSGVDADLQLGFKAPILGWLPFVMIPVGVLLCLAGIFVFRRENLRDLLKRGKKTETDGTQSITQPLWSDNEETSTSM